MAYVDRSSNSRRTATAIAVAAIQAGLIYAVATGLAVKFIAPPKPADPPDAQQIPIKPIPVPDDSKPRAPIPDPRTEHDPVPRDPDPAPNPIPTGEASPGPTGGTGTHEGDVTVFDPPKPPPPTYTPRSATPRGAPGNWATPNDYPARDLREGNQGITRFRLSIGTDGKVVGCEIMASSGFPSLDRTTCEKVARRARFQPATDGYGNRVPGSYSGSIRWEIPN